MPVNSQTIRPPIVDNYDDKNQREVRTAIQQLTTATAFGRLLNVQFLTNSGVYTPSPGTCVILGWSQGAGGGGGGAASGLFAAAGAGGGSGITLKWKIGSEGSPITGGPFSCGAGGTGGSTSGGNGGDGGDTTITVNGVIIVAKGSTGGGGCLSTALTEVAGGVGQVGSSASSGPLTVLAKTSRRGSMSFVINSAAFPTSGADSPYGIGGPGAIAALGPGGDALDFGAGGGGASAQGVAAAGGKGGPGCIEIWEIS